MNANKKLIAKANRIASKFCTHLRYVGEIQEMYEELNKIGITTGIIQGYNKSCEWYFNGELVENSLYCYSVYRPENSSKVEFNIYFS